jgi:hypothetical protein
MRCFVQNGERSFTAEYGDHADGEGEGFTLKAPGVPFAIGARRSEAARGL